jgi:hypothetical protein
MLPGSYWLMLLGWAAVGIALAAAGGYLGATPHFRAGTPRASKSARLRRARSRRRCRKAPCAC